VKRRLLGIAVAVLVGLPVAVRGQASREWKQLRTRHFAVAGDASPEELQRLGRDFEQLHDAVATLRPGARLDGSVPTALIVFRDAATMRPFTLRSRGKPLEWLDAYHTAGGSGEFVVLSPAGGRRPASAAMATSGALTPTSIRTGFGPAYAGYAAELVRQQVKRAPNWLTSGLIDFYSTFEVRALDGRTVVGTVMLRHVSTLKSVSPLPLADLIADDSSTRHRLDYKAARRCDATSWQLVHYLLVGRGGGLRPALEAYLRAMEAGAPAEESFRQAFGDLAELERQVRDHHRLIKLPALVLDSPAAGDPPPVTVMAEADALALQAEILLRQQAYDEAAPLVERAVALDAAHVPARVAQARLLLGRNQAADALAVLADQGLENAERFDVQMVRGDVLLDLERFGEAVEAYRKASVLRPASAFAHYGMSLALAGAGSPEAAAAFSRCLTLRPGAEWFLLRSRATLRLGLDGAVTSDAINWVRRSGWPDGEDSSYVMLTKAFTELRQKKAADAAATLAEIAAHHDKGDWVLEIVAFLRGETPADVFVAKAKDDGQRTEAHAYAGIKANIDGDAAAARRHLDWVKASGRRDFFEYGYALGELRRLARTPAP
jgi:tetratricopeptide (TPR) repeat protein